MEKMYVIFYFQKPAALLADHVADKNSQALFSETNLQMSFLQL